MTLFVALVAHGILILGLSFKAFSDRPRPAPPKLNVTLVQTSSAEAPKVADYLAQTNQKASGTTDKNGHPGKPFIALNPMPSQDAAPLDLQAANAPAQTTRDKSKTLTQRNSPYALPRHAPKPTPPNPNAPTNAHTIKLNLEQARLTAEIRKAVHDYNKMPRRLFLDTVNAKSSVEAAYLARWVHRVERIGNLNYPDAAIRRHLHGRLILNVLLDPNGRVVSTQIAKSSGSVILDQAAKRIVELASPFAPFPASVRKHYDQLMITRTWIFGPNNTLRTR
ncbi:energy transducer TonB [Acidihalobacter ferrooxydans]|nr:energy transducer TonB [Acidihalobacter ferrooxydans]